jgi:hypothetical protein
MKMKNKPDLALLRPSNLSNEIIKRVLKSRETVSKTSQYLKHAGYGAGAASFLESRNRYVMWLNSDDLGSKPGIQHR